MLKLLKPKTGENTRENIDEEKENETRSLYTPTKSVRVNSTQNDDQCASRNMVTRVLTDSTNHPKRPKDMSQSQPASKKRPVVARTLFNSKKNAGASLSLPKALTASLTTFDGKSENI